jgi:hypothetical protein
MDDRVRVDNWERNRIATLARRRPSMSLELVIDTLAVGLVD